MLKRSVILFWLAAALLLAAGCHRLDPTQGEAGSLVLQLTSEEVGTKATPTFNKVLVVVAYRNRTGSDAAKNGTVAAWRYLDTTGPSIEFENLEMGDFTVYVFANVDHTVWEQSGLEIGTTASTVLDGSNKVDVDRLLKTFNATNAPDGLPRPFVAGATEEQIEAALDASLMTGRTNITVNQVYEPANVALQHPVTRLNVTVYNNTHLDVTLNSLSFGAFAMPTAYLFGRTDGNGVPVVPAETPYALCPVSSDLLIPAAQIQTTIPMLVYENAAAADQYRMYATVSLKVDNNTTMINYLGGAAAVGCALKQVKEGVSTPLTYMRRNQAVDIVMNIYYQETSINFDVTVAAWANGGGGSHTFN